MGISRMRLLQLLTCMLASALETEDEMKRSINETGDVIPEWKYKLLSLYEPKPLDLAFKLFLLDSANDQKSATEMYDYLRQSNKLIRPDLEYFAANIDRLNTYTRARFLSLDRMPGMDRTSDCWVVMAYNSTRQLESDTRLGEQLLDHFNEKCQIGFLDYAFPSNQKLMQPLMILDTALLLRFPNSFMTNTKFHPRQWQIELRPVDLWGEVLYGPAMDSLGDQMMQHIEDTIYTQMNEEQKIAAIYSNFNDPEPQKRLMREIIFEFQRLFQSNVRDFINQVVGTNPTTGEWDEKALKTAFPDIMAYQEQLAEDQSLQSYIESRLNNATYMGEKDYDAEQVTRIYPETNIREL